MNSIQHSFIDELLRINVPGVINTLMTRADYVSFLSDYGLGNRLTGIKSMLWFVLFGKKKFQRALKQSNAEIVYIHSVCDVTSMLVAQWASSSCVPVVVSAYKLLMPWHTDHYGFFGRIIKKLIALRIMKRSTTFVHALSNQEASFLLEKFSMPVFNAFSKSSDRISVIEPIVKDTEGIEDTVRFASSFFKLYRKVVDSNPFWLMSKQDLDLENGLLALGSSAISGKDIETTFLPLTDIRGLLSELSDEHWRRIQLHSFDQDVYGYLRIGKEILSDESEDFDVTKVDRIPRAVKRIPLDVTVPRLRRVRMHQVKEDYERHEKEKQLCVMLLNVKYLYSHDLLTRRHLAELYLAVRYEDYDEYVLESMLNDLSILKFAGRILAVLSDAMYLGEGYHPVPAIDDSKAKKIRRKLFKSNIE